MALEAARRRGVRRRPVQGGAGNMRELDNVLQRAILQRAPALENLPSHPGGVAARWTEP